MEFIISIFRHVGNTLLGTITRITYDLNGALVYIDKTKKTHIIYSISRMLSVCIQKHAFKTES